MRSLVLLALCLTAACGLPRADEVDADAKYRLPKDFLLGAGISSYQTEGAWNEDGKGLNVFDYGYHSKNNTPNGDLASDTYHRYEEDIAIAAEIGFNVFRFSFSWARIFPDGRITSLNQKGVDHYHKVLDALQAKNIVPVVTLFHFDYPQALEDSFGGWLGNEMPDVFADYADFAFKTFGSKVKHWLTVNEASWYCITLGSGMLEPKTFTTTEKQNTCLKNTILAHAKAHKIYSEKYRSQQKGFVGFGTGPEFSKAATSAAEDVAAAANNNEVKGIALTIDPLVLGDFPVSAKASRGLSWTEEEKKLIKGAIDFVGINMYGGRNVSASDAGGDDGPPGPPDGGAGSTLPPSGGSVPPGDGGSSVPPGPDGGGPDGGGPDGGSGGGDGNHPDGFGDAGSAWVLREMPKWVKERYAKAQKLPIIITENGVQAGNSTSLDDWDSRAVYCSSFLRELAAGINEDKNDVIGYSLWSFVDTFEFHDFSNWGLVHVDFAGGSLDRTKKASWTFFKRVMETHAVPLVEAGSTPFPSGSAAAQSSIVLAIAAILFSKWLH